MGARAREGQRGKEKRLAEVTGEKVCIRQQSTSKKEEAGRGEEKSESERTLWMGRGRNQGYSILRRVAVIIFR